MLTIEATATGGKPLSFESRVERHHPNLPRFFVLAADPAAHWGVEDTFIVEAEINGCSVGRCSIKPWGDGRWFMDVTQKHCEELAIDTGSLLHVTLRYIADPTPADLASVFAVNRNLERNWSALRPARRRQLSQWIEDARQPHTRQRRVEDIVTMLRRPPAL